MPDVRREPPSALLALAAPGVTLVALTLALLLGTALGRDRIWPSEPLTLPEAAALRDDAEVMRLIAKGADPDAPGRVRPNFLRSSDDVLTPLEAAIGAKREQMVELLLQLGATVDARSWTRLKCFAERHDAAGAAAVLERHRPEGATLDCEDVETPWYDPSGSF